MILLELFKADKDIDYEVLENDSDQWKVNYKLPDGRDLEFGAYESDGVWDVAFMVDGSFDKTGGGSEISVFSAVMSLLQILSTEKKPKAFAMTSEGDNRTSLYKRLFKRLNPTWIQILIPIGGDETLIYTGKSEPVVREIAGDYGFRIGYEFFGYELDGAESKSLKQVPEKARGDIKDLLAKAEELRAKHAAK